MCASCTVRKDKKKGLDEHMMKRFALLLTLLSMIFSVAVAETAYPMDTDVTLKVFTTVFHNNTTLGYVDCNERPITQYINQVTGVNVIWDTLAAGADEKQTFNTMIAADTLSEYDIIISSFFTGTNAEQMIDDGVIISLTDYMDQLPAYTKYFDSVPSLEKKSRTDSGDYYAAYAMRESGWANTFIGPVIRQDWLDACGLDMPMTYADWDHVLRTFKETYGASFSSTLDRTRNHGLSGAFDAYGTFSLTRYLDDEGNVQVGQAQPEWKEYMTALNTWYEEGLIDPDLLTNDDAAVRTKALNGETGLVMLSLGSVDILNSQAQEIGNGAVWVGCPYPTNEDGVVPWLHGNPDVASENYSVIITTGLSEEELSVALAWINFAFTEQGINTWNYGLEGETYNLVDGKPVFVDGILNSDEGVTNAMFRVSGTVGSYWPVQAEGVVRQKNSEPACAAVDAWLLNSDVAKHVLPGITLTQEETDFVVGTGEALVTYVSEQTLKFLTGERSLDEFDAFVAELNKAGLEDYLAVYQTAVDRYNAK